MNLFQKMFNNYDDSNFENFHQSLSPKFNREMVFKAGEGAGRSGSFFFFSHDRKWIIKTMTSGELNCYLKRAEAFAKHFSSNKNSLLAKIFGCFTVNTPYMKKVHIMLMENTMQLNKADELTNVFDLKGSLVDRFVTGKI